MQNLRKILSTQNMQNINLLRKCKVYKICWICRLCKYAKYANYKYYAGYAKPPWTQERRSQETQSLDRTQTYNSQTQPSSNRGIRGNFSTSAIIPEGEKN